MAEEIKDTKNSEKQKALRAAMDKIEKTYGKGSIMKMGDEKVEEVPVISSGSIGLNVALGVGGYPRGRVIEIYGRNRPVNHAGHPCDSRMPKTGRSCRVYRRRARVRPFLRGKVGSRHRQPFGFTTEQWGRSTGDHGAINSFIGSRHHRDRLRGGVDPPERDRGRHGRFQRGIASAIDVAGTPQAHFRDQ